MWVGLLIATASAQSLLDVNAASVAELDALPTIGPAKAHALVVWREEAGPCRRVDELMGVPGWGPATIAALRLRIACGDGAPVDAKDPVSDDVPDGPALHVARVDINQAGPYRLTELPGISLARAHDIVAHREVNGPFVSCAALAAIPGIGAATVALLGDRCAVVPSPRQR